MMGERRVIGSMIRNIMYVLNISNMFSSNEFSFSSCFPFLILKGKNDVLVQFISK